MTHRFCPSQCPSLKMRLQGIALPDLKALEQHKSNLEGAWDAMLKHQLPALPPVQEFWEQLLEFFEWLYDRATPAIPAPYTRAVGIVSEQPNLRLRVFVLRKAL